MTYFVQHQDINASRKDYAHLKDQLLITKVWYTLQGEGPYAGTPAVFVRLAGCNRGQKDGLTSCQFCDTNFLLSEGTAFSYADLEEKMAQVLHQTVESIEAEEHPLVVITGGEPMLQDNLVGFLEHLGRNNWHNIQIESNGDRLAKGFLESKWCETVILVVSPKAGKQGYRALDPNVLRRANYLKCLIDAEEFPYTLPPAYVIAKEPHCVFLSPITVYSGVVQAGHLVGWDETVIDKERTISNYQHAARLSLQHSWLVSMQQHLFFGLE